MFWTLLALLLWVVLGGFISYYGDLQGRRWGKKRVSWFGLRPKHTAILITSLTGGIIAILSIGSAMLLVPTVRNVVLRGEEAIREHQHDITALKIEKKTSLELFATTKAELNSIKEQRRIADAKLVRDQATLAITNRQIKDIQARDAKLLAQDTILESHVAQLQQSVNHKQAEIAQKSRYALRLSREAARMKSDNVNAAFINKDLGRQNLSLTRQNVLMAQSNTDLQAVREQITAKNNELQQANGTLAALNAGLKKAGDDLRTSNEAIYNKSKAVQLQVFGLQAQVKDLTDREDQLYRQLAGTNQSFSQSYSALRQGHLILRANAELARRTLDAHQRADAIRHELSILLSDASMVAEMRGATSGENGRAVRIIAKRVVTSIGVENADEEASLEALVENLVGSDAPTVVVVNAVNNSVQGEQVVIELHARTISRIFDRGAVVASRRIDTRQPVDRLVASILDFLQKDVRDSAIKKGIIPKINPDTGQEEVGIVGPAELVQLTERVRQAGGEVLLSAVAATTLTSADPLDPGDSRTAGSGRTVVFQITRLPGKI